MLAYTGVGALYDPVMHEYADGVLSDAEEFAMAVPREGGMRSPSFGGPLATYCYLQVPPTDVQCVSRDLRVSPFGDEQPIEVGAIASPVFLDTPRFRADVDTYFARAATADVAGSSVIYAWSIEGDALGPPRVVVESTPGRRIAINESYSADGSRLAFVGVDAEDVGAAYLVSTVEEDAEVISVSPPLELGHSVTSVDFVLGGDAVVFGVDQDDTVGTEARYLVDVADGTPGAPMLLDDPGDATEHGPPRIAPDGHALAYWAGDGTHRGLMFRALVDGVPQPAVAIEIPDTHEVEPSSPDWAPDSRWLVYEAVDTNDDTRRTYVVPAADGEPGAPVALLANVETTWPQFPADDQWLYLGAVEDDGTIDLYRVDLSGDQPGEPQQVNAALPTGGRTSFELDVSADLGSLLYLASPDGSSALELWHVDISGPTPGEATRISAPLPADLRVGTMDFSPDGSLVTYTLRPFSGTAARPLFLVDLTAPETVIPVSDDAADVVYLPD